MKPNWEKFGKAIMKYWPLDDTTSIDESAYLSTKEGTNND